jgi:hypothetical protein
MHGFPYQIIEKISKICRYVQSPSSYEIVHDVYSSPSIIRIIKSSRMRWAEHVARMGKREMRIGSYDIGFLIRLRNFNIV